MAQAELEPKRPRHPRLLFLILILLVALVAIPITYIVVRNPFGQDAPDQQYDVRLSMPHRSGPSSKNLAAQQATTHAFIGALKWIATTLALGLTLLLFSSIPIAFAYRKCAPRIRAPKARRPDRLDRFAQRLVSWPFLLAVPPLCVGTGALSLVGAASVRPPQGPLVEGVMETVQMMLIFLWLAVTTGFVCLGLACSVARMVRGVKKSEEK
ncbi:hypothetical protein B0H10DRAFT_2131418 [Mycena sp. CBHHK59/15]|nr:hypothetical protein B0H10DRAFT_2131418 [Mycena sp. CBHHK59/15]